MTIIVSFFLSLFTPLPFFVFCCVFSVCCVVENKTNKEEEIEGGRKMMI